MSEKEYIYFIRDDATGCIKIGISKNPKERLTQLQSSCPGELLLLGAFEGTTNDEKTLQVLFDTNRVRGEWFKPDNEFFLVFLEKIGYIQRTEVEEYGDIINEYPAAIAAVYLPKKLFWGGAI